MQSPLAMLWRRRRGPFSPPHLTLPPRCEVMKITVFWKWQTNCFNCWFPPLKVSQPFAGGYSCRHDTPLCWGWCRLTALGGDYQNIISHDTATPLHHLPLNFIPLFSGTEHGQAKISGSFSQLFCRIWTSGAGMLGKHPLPPITVLPFSIIWRLGRASGRVFREKSE